MIPYIAQILNVNKGELFQFNLEYYSNYNPRLSKDIREIIDLLQYAPISMVEHIRDTLKKFKMNYDDGIKKI